MSLKNTLHKLTTGEQREDTSRWDVARRHVGLWVSPLTFNDPQSGPSLRCQLATEADLLNQHFPDESRGRLDTAAEERMRIANLCSARCVLPVAGVSVDELREMGFVVPRRGRIIWDVLQIVDFPPDWAIRPIHEEPSLVDTSHATVFDPANKPTIDVFFRMDSGDGYPRAHAALF